MKRSMHRFGSLVALLALGGTAHATDSISFVVGGHRVQIEAPRNCRSVSCVSVSIPGVIFRQGRRDRDDVVAPPHAPSVAPPPITAPIPTPPPLPVAPTPPLAAPLVTAASRPAAETVASISPPPPPQPSPDITLAAAATEPVAPPPLPKIETVQTAVIASPVSAAPAPPPPVLKTVPPAPALAQIQEDEQAQSPRGDWQTEGNNGWVRIERCGAALCGYVLDRSTDAKGETVLVNMKPKDHDEWTGSIYSRASGETYYARMTMKGSDNLRVEACAIGRFFCSGNDWARISVEDEKLMTSRQVGAQPHS
jgi:uncharacterized protein (DUF2147 family)